MQQSAPIQVNPPDEPNPNPPACAKTNPTQITVGMRVVVPANGNGPTALREVPHSPKKIKMMAAGEHATVIGGPYKCVCGTIWWKLKTDDSLVGWAIEQRSNGTIGVEPASP